MRSESVAPSDRIQVPASQSGDQRPALSVVMPCYRAAPLARRSANVLRNVLETARLSWEIIIVDDGGGDFDAEEWRHDPNVTLIRLARNVGKGAAVRTGMLAARGDARVFTDIDLPFGTDLLTVMASYLIDRSFHVVIGDRTLEGSSYHMRMPWARRAASAIFSAFVGTLVTGGFFDTQCGIKGVRGDVADAMFPLLRLDRFAFDVELVYVSLKHGLDVKRVPVQLHNNETSSVRLIRDSVQSLVDVFRIKLRQMQGRYDSATLNEIVQRDFLAVKGRATSGRVEAMG